MARVLKEWYDKSEEIWLKASDIAFDWYKRYFEDESCWRNRKYLEARKEVEIGYMLKVFNVANIKPPEEDLFLLSQKLEFEITSKIDSSYPEAKDCLEELRKRGWKLYLSSGASLFHTKGLLMVSGLNLSLKGVLVLRFSVQGRRRSLTGGGRLEP